MVGEITNNLVINFNDNFGRNNAMDYAKGGVAYIDRGNTQAGNLTGNVTYGEKASLSYGPAKLLSVANEQGNYSKGGKMFATVSSVIKSYVNRGDKKTSPLYYQRFFFPGKTTLPWQTNNTLGAASASPLNPNITPRGGSAGY
jgi:hypothetical protein|tara:strand:+ start:1452 stop:1880 length:429 start_codon:yes stop_codon:yes gene_type:complete